MFLATDRATDSNGSIPLGGGGSMAAASAPSSSPPYVSGGGYSSPLSLANILGSHGTDLTPSIPVSSPSMPIGGNPQIGGHTVTHAVPGASGTPSATGGSGSSGGTTTTPAVGPDYFHDILDLVTSQLTTGQPSAAQQFAATPIALPSGSYAGADGSTTDSSGAAAPSTGRPWLGLVVIIAVAGAAYYWFVWRKKHGAAGAA